MKKRFKKFRSHAGYLISIMLFTVALSVIHHKLKQYHLYDVLRQMHQVPVMALLAAAGLTFLNYLTLTLYDTMALRYLGRKISYLRTRARRLSATRSAIMQRFSAAVPHGTGFIHPWDCPRRKWPG